MQIKFILSDEEKEAIFNSNQEDLVNCFEAIQKKFHDTLFYFYGCRSLKDIEIDNYLKMADQRHMEEEKEINRLLKLGEKNG